LILKVEFQVIALMNTEDTISAICTGVGGAISIIRIAGPQSVTVAGKVWHGKNRLGSPNARKMLLGKISAANDADGEPALAVYMPGPNSYTGDDIVELHCHGGTLCARRAFDAVIAAGARLAEPGEFTFRAFVNGKMDMTQAEAVADLIYAHSNMALHLAERQIAGALKSHINRLRTILIDILSECESRMDFTEENLDWTGAGIFVEKISGVRQEINKLKDSGREGVILRNGIRVVLAGKPNVGKSSLLNLLLGYERAIVTQLPGTTRDTLEETANIRNIPVRLTDTAGIREATSMIEGLGIDRSRKTIKEAQIVFWILDASSTTISEDVREMEEHLAGHRNVIVVWNKLDIADNVPLPELKYPSARISVTAQSGINELMDIFEKAVWGFPHTEEPEIAVSARHAALLNEADETLAGANDKLVSAEWELAAVHLRAAIAALGSITGENVSPDILENIFSRFCIGK
jgi:tRNA modification GTPase